MKRAFASLAVIPFAVMHAQGTANPYPTMGPAEQYRMDRAAEVALAKSAAPTSISDSAVVLVLGASGYETAVKGTNGFTCVVERGWANDFGRSDFWNPKLRAPICFNAAATRSVLPDYLKRTRQVLGGMTEATLRAAGSGPIRPEAGAMCYMLSKEGYLGDQVNGPWHPHLMFFFPHTPDAAWGANADHSPVVENDTTTSPITTFMIPVKHWSDGSPDSAP